MSFDTWSLVYENKAFEIRRDPLGEDEFGMGYKPAEGYPSGYLIFPRGTMREIGRLDDSDEAFKRMNNLQEAIKDADEAFFTCDALLTIKSALMEEEKRYRNF